MPIGQRLVSGSPPAPPASASPAPPPPAPPPDTPGVRELGPGRWKVVVTGVDPHTGRRKRRVRTVNGASVDDAMAVRDRLRLEIAGGAPGEAQRVRLHTYAARWMRDRAPLLKPSTRKRYRLALESVILPELGHRYLDTLRPSDVREFRGKRLAAGYAGNTVRNEMRLLRTIARDALADGLCAVYWCDRVPLPPAAEWTIDNPNLLSADEFRRLFAKIPAQWRGLVSLLATTGLRWGEATGLRWGDITAPDSTGCAEAVVRRANWKGIVVLPKTPRSMRVVPVLPEVLAYLGERGDPAAILFPTKTGKLHNGSVLRKVLDTACAAAGVRRITTHGLRRTFNNLARRVTSREVLHALTGHTTNAMTLLYSIVDSGEKRTAAVAVAGSLGLLALPAGTPV